MLSTISAGLATLFGKITAGLLIAAVAAIGFMGWSNARTSEKNASLTSQVASLTEANASLVRSRKAEAEAFQDRLKVAQEALLRKEANAKRLQKALDANPDWAGQRVPDGVASAVWLR